MLISSIGEVIRALDDKDYFTCCFNQYSQSSYYRSGQTFRQTGYYVAKMCETKLLENIAVVKILVANSAFALDIVHKDFKNNFGVALIAVSADADALEICDDPMRDNFEIAINAVRRKPQSARYASIRLQDNEDIAYAAITRDPTAIIHFSDRIKSKKQIGLIVVRRNGLLLSALDPSLQNDDDIICNAIANNPKAISFVGKDKLQNLSFLKSIYSCFPEITQYSFPYGYLLGALVDMRNLRIALGRGAVFLKDKPENRQFNAAAEVAKEAKNAAFQSKSANHNVEQLAFFLFARSNPRMRQPVNAIVEDHLFKLYSL